MKKKLLTLLSLSVSVVAFGQTTLPATMYFQAGETFTSQPCVGSSVTLSPAGANVTVNYSNVTTNGDPASSSFVTASSTPYTSSFPSAEIATPTVSSQGATSYAYYRLNNNVMEMLGVANAQYTLIYNNPQEVYHYPVNYNDSFADVFTGNYSVNGVDVNRYGQTYVKADAWGNITTPTGTFPYLRVKIEQGIWDSMYMSGSLINISYQYVVSYNYYTNTRKNAVFAYGEVSTGSGDFSYANYDVTPSSGLAGFNSPDLASFYPNPVSGNKVHFAVQKAASSAVTASVYDITGKLIKLVTFNELNSNTELEMDLGDIEKGMYLITVTSAGEVYGSRKFVKE